MTLRILTVLRASKPLRVALYLALPLGAIVIAYVATRPTSEATPKQAHDHSATAGGDTAQSVMLSPQDAHRIGVTFAVVSVGGSAREIRTVGQIMLDETRVKLVSSKVDGWVDQLYVNFTGEEVTVGKPLLAIYSPMLTTTQEELLLAKRLQLDVGGASDEARGHAATLVTSARARLALWDVSAEDIAGVEREGHARRSFALRSPVGGFVVEKDVLQGQRVMAGEALYKIADLSRVWLEGDVYEQDMPFVRVGQTAEAELQAIPGEMFAGRVAYIDPTLNPETRTVRVRVELSNAGHRLKPGMFATLRLTVPADRGALTVPRAAVLSTGERHLVFVKRADGMLEPRAVQIGVTAGDRIEILRGLARGETVVASATFLVDAESNLGTALGGMGDMPGMDIAAPKTKKPE
jgi:membrane fusion protein, copper/silver efflux system